MAIRYRVLRGINYKSQGKELRADVGDVITLPAKVSKYLLAQTNPVIEKVTNG